MSIFARKLRLSAHDWFLVTVLAGMASFFFRLPYVIGITAFALMAWFFYVDKRGGKPMPRWFRSTVTLAALGVVLAQYRTLLGLEPGVAFLVLITALKLHELRARRDYVVLIWLASLLLLAELIFSQNLASTFWSFTGLLCVFHSLLLLSSTANFRAPVPPVWQGARRLALLGLPITLALFVVFPRIQLNLFGRFTTSPTALIGFNDELRPGEVAKLAASDEPAFRVSFAGREIPPMGALYWRGAILTATDGNSWMRPRRIREAQPVRPPAEAIAQDIVLEPHANRWLFALDLPTKIAMPSENAAPAVALHGAVFESPRLVTRRLVYRAYSVIARAEAKELDSEARRRNLRLPRRIDPRVAEQGRKLAAKGASPREILGQALDFFRNGFEYTLTPGDQGPGGTADFLFTTKRGFCEHFAAGLALLLRAAGVPARVVVGFHGGEFNPYGKYLTVRYRDAHAWVEAWIPGEGWLRADPTAVVAPERIGQGGQNFLGNTGNVGLGNLLARGPGTGEDVPLWQQMLTETIFFVDSINSQWNIFLLEYDLDYQRELFSRWFAAAPDRKLFGYAFAGAFAVILFVLVLAYGRVRARADRVVASYQLMLARLEKIGVRKFPHEGPLAFVARVTREHPDTEARLRPAIELFIDLRYGRAANDPAKIAEFVKRTRTVA